MSMKPLARRCAYTTYDDNGVCRRGDTGHSEDEEGDDDDDDGGEDNDDEEDDDDGESVAACLYDV